MRKKKEKKFIQPFRLFDKILIGLFFLATTIIYFHNATRDIYSGDIGDLVTASYVFGVAHPPGYPLFTLLGFIFSHIPFPVPIVTRVAYISVISSLAGLGIFCYFSYRVTKNVLLSLLTTSILAFSHFYWVHAELPEVFGLNNLFVIAVLVLATLFYQTRQLHYLYLLGFTAGLSLTHHHTILFIFPAALFLISRHVRYLFSNYKILLFGLLFFITGLLPYLYVPIAASQNPLINWDNVTNLDRFIHLVLRKDYGFAPTLQGTTPLPIKFILVKDYLKTLLDLYSYQIAFVALVGMVALFRKDKWLLTGFLFAFLLSGPFFIFYAAPPVSTTAGWGIIERMYTFSSITFLFFVPFGFLLIKEFLEKKLPRKIYGTALLAYFAIVPVFMLYYNFPKADLSKTNVGNNLAQDILSYLPQNSLLFTEGDTTTFNLWYMHYVLNTRPDIGLINPPGVGGTNYLDKKVNDYKKKNPEVKNADILYLTLEELRKNHRVFGTYQFGHRPKGTTLLPLGMVYELVDTDKIPTKEAYIASIEPQFRKLHIARRETLHIRDTNLITSEVPILYSNALIRVGDFMTQHYKDYQTAEHYYRRSLWVDNENPAGYAGLSLSQYKAYRDCPGAIANMQQAIEQYRVWKTYYIQLYLLHQACNTDKKILDNFKKEYKKEMNSDLENDAKAAQTVL